MLQSVMDWFFAASQMKSSRDHGQHRIFGMPRVAAILLNSGGRVHVDFSRPEDRTRAQNTYPDYVGHILLMADGKWSGEAHCPGRPEDMVSVSDIEGTLEDAVKILQEQVIKTALTESNECVA